MPRLLILLNLIKAYEGKEILNWPYWMNSDNEKVSTRDLLNMREIKGLTAVTKPYYNKWKKWSSCRL